jgi:hypothetical protein
MHPGEDFGYAVSLEVHRKLWMVRGDLVNPAVGEILHGVSKEPSDVAYSGFITCTPDRREPGVRDSFFRFDLADLEALSGGLGQGVAQVADWLLAFTSTRAVIDYLLQRPGEDLRDPMLSAGTSGWALRLFKAASLATVIGDPDASALCERAIEASAPWKGGITDKRNARLLAGRA